MVRRTRVLVVLEKCWWKGALPVAIDNSVRLWSPSRSPGFRLAVCTSSLVILVSSSPVMILQEGIRNFSIRRS